MLTISNSGSGLKVSEEAVNEKRISICFSAIHHEGTSERLQRAFKSHDVTPFNSLRSQLVRVKDKAENLKKCGTIYHIHCEQCDKEYVGETHEHLSRNSQLLKKHCQLTGHSVESNKTKFLATKSNTFKRSTRGPIEIRLRKPFYMNRDNGFELANIYETLLVPSGP